MSPIALTAAPFVWSRKSAAPAMLVSGSIKIPAAQTVALLAATLRAVLFASLASNSTPRRRVMSVKGALWGARGVPEVTAMPATLIIFYC